MSDVMLNILCKMNRSYWNEWMYSDLHEYGSEACFRKVLEENIVFWILIPRWNISLNEVLVFLVYIPVIPVFILFLDVYESSSFQQHHSDLQRKNKRERINNYRENHSSCVMNLPLKFFSKMTFLQEEITFFSPPVYNDLLPSSFLLFSSWQFIQVLFIQDSRVIFSDDLMLGEI